MGSALFNQAYAVQRITTEFPPDSVVAGVEFGTMSRDGHCVNVGICRMTSEEFAWEDISSSRRQCRKALVRIAVRSDGGISFSFPQVGMLPCTARALFRPGYFPLPQDFVFPAEIASRLPGHARLEIPAGRYRVIDTGSSYLIHF